LGIEAVHEPIGRVGDPDPISGRLQTAGVRHLDQRSDSRFGVGARDQVLAMDRRPDHPVGGADEAMRRYLGQEFDGHRLGVEPGEVAGAVQFDPQRVVGGRQYSWSASGRHFLLTYER
jgi:hypothetical protein